MQAFQVPSKEERSKLADRIVELSSGALSKDEESCLSYIALKVGSGPYSNVATVWWRKDMVTFHLPSSDLEKRANDAKLGPENENSSRLFFKHKCRFYGLTPAKLHEHEPLFRAIVKDSLEHVIGWRAKGK